MTADHETGVLNALFKVADRARETEIESVLIIYRDKNGMHSADNDLTVSEANLMLDAFKMWLMTCYVNHKKAN